MVFMLGILVIVFRMIGVHGGGSLVGDQREIILAGDEGQEEDVQRECLSQESH